MNKITIDGKTAARFLIAYQGLDRYEKGGRERAILSYMGKVGSIQFDPLDICGRNAELVLQARVKNFRPDDLYRLLYEKRELTEGWDKMMCIYNMRDFPAFKRRRDKDLAFYKSDKCLEIRDIAGKIIEDITVKGPLSSLELDYHEKINWSWAPAKLSKAALEILFFSGQLAIDSRINSRRLYNLAEKVIPGKYYNVPDPNIADEDFHDWAVLRRLKSIGLYYAKSGDGWLGMIKKKERDEAFARLEQKGKVLPVTVRDLPWQFYIPSEELALLKDVETGRRRISRNVRFLAPLDNFMWDRRLIDELFGFTYRWEVYKPKVQREYGYYVLPVLYGDRFIGRIEPVRNKKTGRTIIKNWWWEPGVEKSDKIMFSIESALTEFSRFLQSDIDRGEALNLIYSS